MSVDYYAIFEPVLVERDKIIDPLNSVLFELDAKLEVEFDQLIKTDEGFDYTFHRKRCNSLADAIKKSSSFDGIEYSFVIEEISCSFLVWNDDKTTTTVSFCEPKQLFVKQVNSRNARAFLFKILMSIMDEIGARFCIFEAEADYKSVDLLDVSEWINVGRSDYPDKWRLVIAKDSVLPSTDLPDSFKDEEYWKYIIEFDGWIWSSIGAIAPKLISNYFMNFRS